MLTKTKPVECPEAELEKLKVKCKNLSIKASKVVSDLVSKIEETNKDKEVEEVQK